MEASAPLRPAAHPRHPAECVGDQRASGSARALAQGRIGMLRRGNKHSVGQTSNHVRTWLGAVGRQRSIVHSPLTSRPRRGVPHTGSPRRGGSLGERRSCCRCGIRAGTSARHRRQRGERPPSCSRGWARAGCAARMALAPQRQHVAPESSGTLTEDAGGARLAGASAQDVAREQRRR